MTDKSINIGGALWFTIEGMRLGNHQHMALLAAIDRCGSITQAAKTINMSYKAAWDAINTMNNLAKEPLVERISGGKGGGGTVLTQRGHFLIKNFFVLEARHREFIEQLSTAATDVLNDFALIQKMRVQTSARNQMLTRITAIVSQGINDVLTLALSPQQWLTAVITHESTLNLALEVNTEVFALFKAPHVRLWFDQPSVAESLYLTGQVIEHHYNDGLSELTVALIDGHIITATQSLTHSEQRSVDEGLTVFITVDPQAIILALP